MTLKEIAREAGVSISTVSRIINDPNHRTAAPEAAERVWEIVRRTGYTPNEAAKALKSRDQGPDPRPAGRTISCVFARTEMFSRQFQDQMMPSDQFFAEILRAVEKEAMVQGCSLGFSFSAVNLSDFKTDRMLENLDKGGVVVLGRPRKELLGRLQKLRNVIVVGLAAGGADFDQVICDGYKAAIQVLEYLYRQGHRRIGYLGEVKNEVRFDAYMDFMLERELPFSEEYIYESALTMENGYFGIKRMFASPRLPTAVFCANDISAIGAVKAIREFGLHIPQDISVISIDNIAMSQFTTPSLTTVDVPKNELGKVAVKLLLDRIEKGHTLPLKVELPCKLIVRESCRPLEKGERE
ncbi:LacI family DNA-binding transcriptional regulator [Bittarella massiliensis]|uniref:LacI family DNA-binding transcriptional regulator n=1 Tax=Bittarella massiliensis (ex Durand et al. 2017) TaxID=1720313 RepID=UPI00163BA940|nr:LacI family DNA-binding transcriptional regulator [Bittarella massiliensis (ex Durand et al. 2017)]MBC2870118.1 LacI family DNA-binding transcriptional regulator [Bittarella massiliensis (ex Durand et al. 2017)]